MSDPIDLTTPIVRLVDAAVRQMTVAVIADMVDRKTASLSDETHQLRARVAKLEGAERVPFNEDRKLSDPMTALLTLMDHLTKLERTSSGETVDTLARRIKAIESGDLTPQLATAISAQVQSWMQGIGDGSPRNDILARIDRLEATREPPIVEGVAKFRCTVSYADGYAAGVAAERERCAKVAETAYQHEASKRGIGNGIAALIRSGKWDGDPRGRMYE